MDTTTTTTTPRRLPMVLEDIRVATPCSADWDDMTGDARVRFCGKCEKNVYNLSAMTREEGEALVRQKEGRLCVRLYQRKDGTVITSDCPVGVRRQRLRARVWASISGAAASAALLLGLFGGRARADLTVDGKKVAGTQQKTGEMKGQVEVRVMGGAVAVHEPPQPPAPPPGPDKHPPLMGKIALPPPPKKVEPVMGEPVMGDIAIAEPKTKTKRTK